MSLTAQCECGAAVVSSSVSPLLRYICHCSLCQQFNNAAFVDMTVLPASRVLAPAAGQVNFSTLRPPPNVERGVCASCNKPALERMNLPLVPQIIFVPSKNYVQADALPAPAFHAFYDSRLADADDGLPKYSGYWPSQLAFVRAFIAGAVAGGRV